MPGWICLGADPSIVKRYDNKVDQYQLFVDLNLPRNRATIFSSPQAAEESILACLPCYVSASYASGGNESGFVYSADMLHKILSGLRQGNKLDRFLVSEVFDCLLSAPNATGIVTGRDKTQLLVVSDQILAGTRYLGNVYPSAITPDNERMIQEIMITIGDHLSREGFRGLFGCDFLVDSEGNLVVVDLNPRRQGGYLCNVLSLASQNVDLISMELDCALLGQTDAQIEYSQLRYPRVWAHSKVKPYGPGQRVRGEPLQGCIGQLFKSTVPVTYAASFYEPGSMFLDGYIGYVVTTGYDRREVLRELKRQTTKLLSDSLYVVATSSDENDSGGKEADIREKDFRGADLRSLDLRDLYLRGANLLREADLREVDLSRKDMSGADLSGATLLGANLEGACLNDANLVGAILDGVNMKGCQLVGARLTLARLTGANLEEANLKGAVMEDAVLRGTTLARTNLEAAVLDRASLNEATVKEANLTGASLNEADLTQVNLKDANLSLASMRGARLCGANLSGINLSGADMTRARMERVSLKGANLNKARLDHASLDGADLDQADLSNASLVGASLKRASLCQANFKGANLKGATLVRAELREASLQDADLESANLSWTDLTDVDLDRVNLAGTNMEQSSIMHVDSTTLD